MRSREAGEPAGRVPALCPAGRDRLVRLAYRFLWDRDDAEDVVHDALITARERADDLRDADKWWSWVGRIVVRRCHEQSRRKLVQRRHQESLRIETARRSEQSHTDNTGEFKERIRRLLHDLPRRQHEVIVLRHLQGMSYGEIADLLEISPATARVHAQAGREALRHLLLQRHPDWCDESARHKRSDA